MRHRGRAVGVLLLALPATACSLGTASVPPCDGTGPARTFELGSSVAVSGIGGVPAEEVLVAAGQLQCAWGSGPHPEVDALVAPVVCGHDGDLTIAGSVLPGSVLIADGELPAFSVRADDGGPYERQHVPVSMSAATTPPVTRIDVEDFRARLGRVSVTVRCEGDAFAATSVVVEDGA